MRRQHTAFERAIGRMLKALFVFALMVGAISFVVVHLAHAHDSWISRGALKNAAGEWCCGEGDCFVIPSEQVRHVTQGPRLGGPGYVLRFEQVVDGVTVGADEFVPEAEAQPSPDGEYWRCKRPDGTRRCFFAPPPNT